MTTALCHGCFEVLHPAHIRHLTAARKLADRLIVSITADAYIRKGPGRPVFNEQHRAEMLRALRCVDNVVVVNDATAVPVIEMYKPNFYCKGSEYAHQDWAGNLALEKQAVESYGGKFVIIPEDIRFSSTKIVTGEMLKERQSQIRIEEMERRNA
jgi:rfaE bifunctional protein nucleotidyltransferase chain/domain